jgi:Fe-S oxidoreductase
VFRDELIDLLPHDHDAKRLAQQSFTLAEFLGKVAPHYSPPALRRKILVHGHCHQKALIGVQHEADLLKKMGADVNLPDTGCCGMAGSFGFEKDKFDLSEKIFAHELQSHIEAASGEILLVAGGFNCRTQIEQNTNRRALHLAQIIKMAIDGEEGLRELSRNDRYVREWVTAGMGLVALFIGARMLARRRHQKLES